MFDRWGRIVYRRRWLVLAVAGAAVIVAAVWGTGVFARLQSAGGFAAPGSQSQREANLATRTFGRDSADVVVIYSARHGAPSVTTPAVKRAIGSTLAALPASDVSSYATYWTTGSPQFVSPNGRHTYAVIELAGGSDASRISSFNAIAGRLAAPGLNAQVAGPRSLSGPDGRLMPTWLVSLRVTRTTSP